MAKASSIKNKNSAIKDAQELNATFNNGFSKLSGNTTNINRTNELNTIDNSINHLIRSEINNTKSITTNDMSTFLVKVFNDIDRGSSPVKSIEDIFESDDDGLIQFFQDRYANRNLYFEDLNMICTQLYEMDEAIMTTRDAIITADDFSQSVSRTLSFANKNDDDCATYINSIEDMERKIKLPSKIKNQIIPNTLKYGSYYVYSIPYSKLFEQQYRHMQNDIHAMGQRTVKEAIVSESFDTDLFSELKNITTELKSNDTIKSTFDDLCENIEVLNDVYSIPLVEGVNVSGLLDDNTFRKHADDTIKNANKDIAKYTDGIYDKKDVSFENTITDCYIKFIDPRRIIPIKILDSVIGYYYVHESELRVNKAPFSTSIRVTNSSAPGQKSEDIEAVFLSKVTDKIVASFDKKFVENNAKFKDIILNSLIYNDVYNRQLTFQFIPKDYITEFKVNEDEDKEGQSVLKKSLFYAKLYLSLLVFKMVSIINRSNDTRMYYIKNSGLDSNIVNKVQDVARSIKGRQMNFMDLLNYNSIISRIGHNKELFIPTGRNGEKGIDFDILQGQDIPLNTDLMEMLRTNMINGTGVPSIIMNYINEADYAKTIQMGHAKFIGRTINHQLDFNPQITELYKKIIKFSGIQIPDEYTAQFVYTLNPPKTANNINSSDVINVGDQIASAIVKAKIGESESDEITGVVKDIMYDKVIREFLPMIDWAMMDDIYKDSRVKAIEKINNKQKEET